MADDKTQDFQKRVEVEKPRSQEDFSKQDKGQAERAFEKAGRVEQRQQTQERARGKSLDSEQVKNSRPHMMPTPNGPMRSGADRQAHAERSAADDKTVHDDVARRRANAVMERKNLEREQNRNNERER